MNRTAVVTGAGSGVGRAVALALAKEGWDLALLGRREGLLEETAQLTGLGISKVLVCACDIGRPEEVSRMSRLVNAKFSGVNVLVNAAGTNVPNRGLDVLSWEDYRAIIDANLDGAYLCAQAFLPSMRAQGSGTIINIVSDAAKQASAKAGPAYVMSKAGMAGLTQSINAEERGHGIRACAIFPGDIDTPLLEKRPNPPPAEARQRMLWPEDVAACALLAINLPERAIVEEILIKPR